MLFIAFENDHIIPPKATRHNASRSSEGSKALTSFREFPGRPHFPGAPGWEECGRLRARMGDGAGALGVALLHR